jgi:hypothetical protein
MRWPALLLLCASVALAGEPRARAPAAALRVLPPGSAAASGVVFGSRGESVAFTRSSVATCTGTDGTPYSVATDVPCVTAAGVLVERAGTNIALRSEEFDNASWVKISSAITANATTSPVGTATADKLTETAVTDFHTASQQPTLSDNTVYAHSIFAKAAERTRIQLQSRTKANTFVGVTANLSTCTTISATTGTSGYVGHSVTSAGNGWCRVAVLVNALSGATAVNTFVALDTPSGGSYLGVVGNGAYIWGYQVEQSTVLTSYIPTTGASATRTAPTITSVPLPIDSNFLLRSQEFDNATWTKSQSTVTANATTAPDSTSTADKLVETAVSNFHFLTQTVSLAANTPYTITTYAKAAERTKLTIEYSPKSGGASSNARFDLSAGTVFQTSQQTEYLSSSIEALANGWYRCSLTINSGVGAFTPAILLLLNDASSAHNYLGDGTSGLYLWGAQSNVGTTAKTYLVTTSAVRTSLDNEGCASVCVNPLWTGMVPTANASFFSGNLSSTWGYTVTDANVYRAFNGTVSIDTPANWSAGVTKCFRTEWSTTKGTLAVENLTDGSRASVAGFTGFPPFTNLYLGQGSIGDMAMATLSDVRVGETSEGCR